MAFRDAADKFTRASEASQNRLDSEAISDMEDALKEMTIDCMNAKFSYLVEPINTPFFNQLYNFLMLMRYNNEIPKELGSRLGAVFQFVKEAGKHESLRTILRDSYGMLAFLGYFFQTEFPLEDRVLIMEVIEIMTRGFTVIWKPSYMNSLVKKTFTHLLGVMDNPKQLHTTLQFLVSICQSEPCVLVVRNDEKYKEVFRVLGQMFLGGEAKNPILSIYPSDVLFVHLLFLIGTSIPHDNFDSGYSLVKKYTQTELARRKKQLSDESQGTVEHAGKYLSDSLNEATALVVSIVNSMKDVYLHAAAEEYARHPRWSLATSSRIKASKEHFFELITNLLGLLHDFMTTVDKPHVEDIKGILNMTLILIPTFVPKLQFLDVYKTALNIGKLALGSENPDPTLRQLTLSIFQHVTEQIMDDRHKISSQFKDINPYFVQILNGARFSTETEPACINLNTLLARLLSSLSSYPGLREQIALKFDIDLITEFVNNVLECKTGTGKEKMDRSVCLVELLCALAERPEVVDLFMKLVSKPKVCEIIAHCIHHGSERATTRALRVIGSAPFDHNNLPLITNGLMSMRVQSPPVPPPPRFTHDLNPLGCEGVYAILDSANHETSDLDKRDPTSVNFLLGDLLTFHKLKTQLHKVEKENLQAQVEDVNRINLQLHHIMELQNEFVTKRLLVAEKENAVKLSLQHELIAEKEAFHEKERTWAKKTQTLLSDYNAEKETASQLREKLEEEESKNTSLKKDFSALELAKAELTKKLTLATDEKRSWRSEANRTKTELTQNKAQLANLEEAVKKKEEERANACMLLEKEKKMLDTIRGLVGNNFGNLNLG